MPLPQDPDSATDVRAVLAATDFSLGAGVALERAARIASHLGAPLELVHVFDEGLWSFLADPSREQKGRDETGMRLSEHASDLERRFGIEATAHMVEGQAAVAIAEFVLSRPARLLVVGEHGENWIRDLVKGGTALKVLERAGVPVLLARRPVAAEYARILVATDFSQIAARAARFAMDLFPDVPQTLVHAYSVLFEGRMRLVGSTDADIERFREAERTSASRRMADFVDAVGWGQGTGSSPRLVLGPPALVILEEAALDGADLVVLGKHGGGPVVERLLGSVTQNILYYAEADVLVVP